MMNSVTRTVSEGMYWLLASTVILKIIGVATIVIVFRTLSMYEYGLVELALSTVPLLGIFFLPGLSTIITNDMLTAKSQGKLSHVRSLFEEFFIFQMIFGVFGFLIVFFGASIVAQFYEGNAPELLRIVAFLFLIIPFRTAISILQGVHLKFFGQSLYSVIEEVGKFILLILFFFFGFKVDGLLLSIVISQLLVILLFLPKSFSLYRSFANPQTKREQRSLLELMKTHGKWGIMGSYIGSFGNNARLWIIKFILGTEAVGLFAAAYGFLGHVIGLIPFSRIMTALFPQYVDDPERFKRFINKSTKYQFYIYLPLGIVSFFLYPIIVTLLFPNFIASITPFRIMLLALLPLSIDTIFSPVFYALKAQKSLFFAMVYKAALTIILTAMLAFYFGINGVVYAYVLAGLLYLLERYRALKKLLPGFKVFLKEFVIIDKEDKIILHSVLKYFLVKSTKIFSR